FFAIRFVGFVARGTERGSGSLGDALQERIGSGFQGDEIFIDDAAHTVPGAEEFLDVPGLFCLEDYTDEGLVDDGSRAAALADDRVAFECVAHGVPLYG